MNNKNSFEIIPIDDILVKNVNRSTIKFDQDRIEKIWEKICYKKNNKLFNGKVLTLVNSFTQNNTLILEGSFVDYKLVISSRSEPSLGLKIQPIGVSGITFVNDDDVEYVLFSTRSSKNTEYPNFLELVPSGSIDISALKSDETVDYSGKLIEEFTEETGLDKHCIQEIKTLCLVKDNLNQVFDICCKIKILNSKSNILSSFETVSEYGKPELIPLHFLSNYVQNNYNRLVPTSLAILSRFINK
jgi:hypothetical protein